MNFCYKIELPKGLADLLCGREVKSVKRGPGIKSRDDISILSDNGCYNNFTIQWGDGSKASDQSAKQKANDLLKYVFDQYHLSLHWNQARDRDGKICHMSRDLLNEQGQTIGGDNWCEGVRIIKEEYDLETQTKTGLWSSTKALNVESEYPNNAGGFKATIDFLPAKSIPNLELYKLLQLGAHHDALADGTEVYSTSGYPTKLPDGTYQHTIEKFAYSADRRKVVLETYTQTSEKEGYLSSKGDFLSYGHSDISFMHESLPHGETAEGVAGAGAAMLGAASAHPAPVYDDGESKDDHEKPMVGAADEAGAGEVGGIDYEMLALIDLARHNPDIRADLLGENPDLAVHFSSSDCA